MTSRKNSEDRAWGTAKFLVVYVPLEELIDSHLSETLILNSSLSQASDFLELTFIVKRHTLAGF